MSSDMRINEVLELFDPERREVLRDLLAREKLPEDVLVIEFMQAYPSVRELPQEEAITVLMVQIAQQKRNLYAPKLTFYKRCEILALHKMGFGPEVLSKMYQIDRRTVTHIYTDHSPHYKNVRREFIMLGPDKFREKYLPDYQNVVETAMSYYTDGKGNNKFAKGKAGLHTMRNGYCDYDHRVAIQWIEAGQHEHITTAGWYYRDLDGSYPERWFSSGTESEKTSLACYKGAMENIADPIKMP